MNKEILREEAKEGMVLAQAVEDSRGRVILAPGATLTAVIISRLGRWGVETMVVESNEQDGPGPEGGPDSSLNPDEIDEHLNKAFRLVADDPNMQIVKQVCREVFLGKA